MKVNINDTVKVKLNDTGYAIITRQHIDLKLPGKCDYPKEDADGWSKWHMWELMGTFGPKIFHGCTPPFHNIMEIEGKPNSGPGAVDLIKQYGSIDGAHHKQWVLDQVLHVLLGDKYDAETKELYQTYGWEKGIAP